MDRILLRARRCLTPLPTKHSPIYTHNFTQAVFGLAGALATSALSLAALGIWAPATLKYAPAGAVFVAGGLYCILTQWRFMWEGLADIIKGPEPVAGGGGDG